jgi:hypothetical protein
MTNECDVMKRVSKFFGWIERNFYRPRVSGLLIFCVSVTFSGQTHNSAIALQSMDRSQMNCPHINLSPVVLSKVLSYSTPELLVIDHLHFN